MFNATSCCRQTFLRTSHATEASANTSRSRCRMHRFAVTPDSSSNGVAMQDLFVVLLWFLTVRLRSWRHQRRMICLPIIVARCIQQGLCILMWGWRQWCNVSVTTTREAADRLKSQQTRRQQHNPPPHNNIQIVSKHTSRAQEMGPFDDLKYLARTRFHGPSWLCGLDLHYLLSFPIWIMS